MEIVQVKGTLKLVAWMEEQAKMVANGKFQPSS